MPKICDKPTGTEHAQGATAEALAMRIRGRSRRLVVSRAREAKCRSWSWTKFMVLLKESLTYSTCHAAAAHSEMATELLRSCHGAEGSESRGSISASLRPARFCFHRKVQPYEVCDPSEEITGKVLLRNKTVHCTIFNRLKCSHIFNYYGHLFQWLIHHLQFL